MTQPSVEEENCAMRHWEVINPALVLHMEHGRASEREGADWQGIMIPILVGVFRRVHGVIPSSSETVQSDFSIPRCLGSFLQDTGCFESGGTTFKISALNEEVAEGIVRVNLSKSNEGVFNFDMFPFGVSNPLDASRGHFLLAFVKEVQ